MNNEPTSSNAIFEAASQVCSKAEFAKVSEQQGNSFLHLVATRLDKPGPAPTKDELQGIKELVTEHLWHPAFNRLSTPSPDSATTSSKTSD